MISIFKLPSLSAKAISIARTIYVDTEAYCIVFFLRTRSRGK